MYELVPHHQRGPAFGVRRSAFGGRRVRRVICEVLRSSFCFLSQSSSTGAHKNSAETAVYIDIGA